MNGRGRDLDNIFIERLGRSLKKEAIYLEEIDDGFQAGRVVKDWITFYNTKRPHSAPDRATPGDAYWAGLEVQKAASILNPILPSKAAKLSEKVGSLHFHAALLHT